MSSFFSLYPYWADFPVGTILVFSFLSLSILGFSLPCNNDDDDDDDDVDVDVDVDDDDDADADADDDDDDDDVVVVVVVFDDDDNRAVAEECGAGDSTYN